MYVSTDSLVPRLSPKTFLFFVGARGEPGNEANVKSNVTLNKVSAFYSKAPLYINDLLPTGKIYITAN